MLFKLGDEANAGGRPTKEPLEALELSITEKLSTLKSALAGEGTKAAKQIYAEQMKPIEFKKLFKQYRAEQDAKKPGKAWKSIVCPIRIEEDVCEACGKGYATLPQCGGCRSVAYCGTTCQREE